MAGNNGAIEFYNSPTLPIDTIVKDKIAQLESNTSHDETRKLSIIWGPTCDGQDCIMKECLLPELDVGQWMYFRDMGAYTITSSCDFNGITRPIKLYVCDILTWGKVYLSETRFNACKPASTQSSTITNGCAYMAGSDLDGTDTIPQQQINTELVRLMV